MIILIYFLRAVAVILCGWVIFKVARAAFRSADVSEQLDEYHDTISAANLVENSGIDPLELENAREMLENLSETVENSIIDKNGNEKVIVWNNALINDKNGEIYGTVSSGINITEKVKIQEEQNLIIEILNFITTHSKSKFLIFCSNI